MTVTFRPESDVDRDIFGLICREAADSFNPTYIGDIKYDAAKHFERWLEEGRMRSAVNKKTGKADDKQAERQRIENCKFTCDELGRITEGPIELMWGLTVAAVVEDGTDDRPDLCIDGVQFDVKGSYQRQTPSFSLPVWTVKKYEALLLVQHVEPGLARVWACKCGAKVPWKEMPPAPGKKHPFFLIRCPAPNE